MPRWYAAGERVQRALPPRGACCRRRRRPTGRWRRRGAGGASGVRSPWRRASRRRRRGAVVGLAPRHADAVDLLERCRRCPRSARKRLDRPGAAASTRSSTTTKPPGESRSYSARGWRGTASPRPSPMPQQRDRLDRRVGRVSSTAPWRKRTSVVEQARSARSRREPVLRSAPSRPPSATTSRSSRVAASARNGRRPTPARSFISWAAR